MTLDSFRLTGGNHVQHEQGVHRGGGIDPGGRAEQAGGDGGERSHPAVQRGQPELRGGLQHEVRDADAQDMVSAAVNEHFARDRAGLLPDRRRGGY
jgi:hypothetical protein